MGICWPLKLDTIGSFFGKLCAILAQYLGREKGRRAGENLIVGHSPLISEPLRAFSSCFGNTDDLATLALISSGRTGFRDEAQQFPIHMGELRHKQER
jgi:hypothetical protein